MKDDPFITTEAGPWFISSVFKMHRNGKIHDDGMMTNTGTTVIRKADVDGSAGIVFYCIVAFIPFALNILIQSFCLFPIKLEVLLPLSEIFKIQYPMQCPIFSPKVIGHTPHNVSLPTA